MRNRHGWKTALKLWMLVVTVFLAGCAGKHAFVRETKPTVYMVKHGTQELIERYAPVFMVENFRETFNRIGSVTACIDERGNEDLFIDHQRPALYYMAKTFQTDRANYTNLIYRVHFQEVPFTLVPFTLTAGKNVGVMAIITLDEKEKPVLLTTVGTCGCYAAIIPTSNLPPDTYPEKWEKDSLNVYGERLPSLLDFSSFTNPKIMITLRSHVHRVMDIKIREEASLTDTDPFFVIKASLLPMDSLEKIHLNGKTTSLYHDTWPLKGYVKGSFKVWETLFLSIISLDFFVGTDKLYGDSRVTGNPFYTSLKPWNRNASDMWDFTGFLKFWGWRL
ncbi:MAG: hypothetical protein SV686_12630 [Thermodesulfobacteriota bacterium]|nr:hypothetical protein [Thermodesulfobacteriota bacterium]